MPSYVYRESVSVGLAKEHSASMRSNSQPLDLIVDIPVKGFYQSSLQAGQGAGIIS